MTETTRNYCPRCKENQMRIAELPDGSKTGVCHNCGYQFSNSIPQTKQRGVFDISKLLQTVSDFSFVIAILAIIISIVVMSSIGSVDNNAKVSINALDTEFTNKINSLNETVNSTLNVVDNHTGQVNYLMNSINSLSSTITSLQNLNSNMSRIEQLISQLNETLNSLRTQYENEQFFLTTTNCTLRVTEYPNQNITDGSVFAEVEIIIQNPNITLHDTFLKIFYKNSVWNETSSNNTVSPIFLPYTEYAEINWIDNSDEHHIKLHLEWNTTSYYTTIVNTDNIVYSLMVNNNYFNFYTEKIINSSVVQ